MENHPIPQDITGFQFKLIGEMTIKQFGYVAAGAIIAWLIYSSPLIFFIKIPLAVVSAILGVSLAFLPVEGRPLDTMVISFIKAMFSSTQFIYERSGVPLYAAHAVPKSKKEVKQEVKQVKILQEQATQASHQVKQEAENKKKETVYFSSLASMYGNQPLQNQSNINPTVSSPHAFDKVAPMEENPLNARPTAPLDPNKEKEVVAKEQELEKELQLVKQQQASADPALAQKAKQEAMTIEEELRKTIDEKDRLEQQLVELNRRLDQQKQNVFTPSVAEAPRETKNVRVVPQGLGNSIGLPIVPDSPNVISGILKDPRGNPLPNILVEVKDGDANPVRAFKTNGVGQFASATALTNGVYTIDFEDPKEENKFDSIQFEATGQIILPIEVISTDKREELRRELFN